MQIEHAPWLPKNAGGVNGQRIAFVGYSHHSNEPDRSSLTNDVLQFVVDREHQFQFFRAIQGYFGFTDAADFWNRGIFFNFLPDAVGPGSNKYADGTPGQLVRGRERLVEIINDEKPDKVFVFTSKGWRAFPETTVEELSGGTCKPLMSGLDEPNWGTYMAGHHRVLVCGFRHPQFANRVDLTKQVQTFLALQA